MRPEDVLALTSLVAVPWAVAHGIRRVWNVLDWVAYRAISRPFSRLADRMLYPQVPTC